MDKALKELEGLRDILRKVYNHGVSRYKGRKETVLDEAISAITQAGYVKLSSIRLDEGKVKEMFCEMCGTGCQDVGCGFTDIIEALASKSSELLEVRE